VHVRACTNVQIGEAGHFDVCLVLMGMPTIFEVKFLVVKHGPISLVLPTCVLCVDARAHLIYCGYNSHTSYSLMIIL